MGGHAGSLERLPGRRPASPLEKALWGRAHRQPLQPGLMPGSAPALLRSPATPDLRGPRLFRAQYWLDGGAAGRGSRAPGRKREWPRVGGRRSAGAAGPAVGRWPGR